MLSPMTADPKVLRIVELLRGGRGWQLLAANQCGWWSGCDVVLPQRGVDTSAGIQSSATSFWGEDDGLDADLRDG